MADINNSKTIEDEKARSERTTTKKSLWLIVLVLVLLFSLSSCVIGFKIGKTYDLDGFTGRIIDTIVIPFGTGSGSQTQTQIDIRGQVIYTDGTPYANGSIKLQSDPRYTTTDGKGYFEFFDVPAGNHTVSVVSDDKEIAKCSFVATKTEAVASTQIHKLSEGNYRITLPITINIVDLVLELKHPIAETGEIIKDAPPTLDLVLNSFQPQKMPEGVSDGHKIRDDVYTHYVYYLPSTTKPGTYEPGTTQPGTTQPGTTQPGTTQPGTTQPGTTQPGTTQPGTTQPGTTQPGTTQPGTTQPGTTQPGTTQPGTTVPVIPPYYPPTDRSPDFNVASEAAGSELWNSSTLVDIFGVRDGNTGVQTIDGRNVIAPGSQGKYIFRVLNPENLPLGYTISLSESDENVPALPMLYRLKRGISGSDYIGDSSWKSADVISLSETTIQPLESTYYTLEWKWATVSDTQDTEIGNQGGSPMYVLNINITAWIK